MPLKKIGAQQFASVHFTFRDRSIRERRRYYVVAALTDIGRLWLPHPTPPMPALKARAFVADLERRIVAASAPVIQKPLGELPATLTTGKDVVAMREALFPGLTPTEGWKRMATLAQTTPDYIRHMETGFRRVYPRTAGMLLRAGRALMQKYASRARRADQDLVQFADLYDALAAEEASDAGTL